MDVASEGRSAGLQSKRILVVEDEWLVAMMVEDALIDAGALVLGPVTSVLDALRLVEASAAGGINAAVLDVNLLGETVIPVADALCERGVPFLFATGYEHHSDMDGYASAPVLQKPYEPRQLIAALGDLCSSRNSVSALS